MSEAFRQFAAMLHVSDKLIEQSSNDEIAGVARVLALHVAYYQMQYGPVSMDKCLKLLTTETIDDDQAMSLAEGFAVLAGVIKILASPAGEH